MTRANHDWPALRARCREKASRGNAYPTEDRALVAARYLSRKRMVARLRVYRCVCCRKWHIGG